MSKLPIFILCWLLYLIIDISLMLLGFIVIPFCTLYKLHNKKKSDYFDRYILKFPKYIDKIWGNEEDGISAEYWYGKSLYHSYYPNYWGLDKKILRWSMIRNPTNNLRFVPILSVVIDPSKVKFIGNLKNIKNYDTAIPQWFLAWQGLYSSFYWQFNLGQSLYRFWIGWKILPTDIYGIESYRKPSAGFALQFKKVD